MAANVPLVESGTAGYLGQVQPILKVRLLRFLPWRPLITTTGPDGVFRLRYQTDPKDFPSLYHSLDALTADSLHCLGQKLSLFVRLSHNYSSGSLTSNRQLFGEDEDASGEAELSEALQQGENGAWSWVRSCSPSFKTAQ